MSATTKIERRLLFSRFLTRAGDQAWDFAVPLTLVKAFPASLHLAAAYYLCIRGGQVLLAPRVGRLIDRWQRPPVIKCGIGLQTVGMVAATCTMIAMTRVGSVTTFSDPKFIAMFLGLVIFGIASSLGALMMEIAVANDIVPAAVPEPRLAFMNSRLKQIDLATEVSAPIVAGLLLTVGIPGLEFGGFVLVALWNVMSFLPEYVLVRSVLRAEPSLTQKPVDALASIDAPLLQRLSAGWRLFLRQPIMPAMLAYSMLWLSVLSPHGVILTAFLKGGWQLSETTIGLFRGLGAAFGLLATYLFPLLSGRIGVISACRYFIAFQAACLVAALALFRLDGGAQLAFLGLILLSRIGLYGFDLGETQLRQTRIQVTVRGEVNSFASALTSIATLGLYGAGALLARPEDFGVLVYSSVVFVVIAAIIFGVWSVRPPEQPISEDILGSGAPM